MAPKELDYLIIGPAHPFRGGIAETQHELAKALLEQGYTVRLITFTKLYPKFLFPGTSPYTTLKSPKKLVIDQDIHAYYPWRWKKTSRYINSLKPKNVIFRYYTPFLAPVYVAIAKRLEKNIKRSALVDNWFPHESNLFDKRLNKYFGKQMQSFTTLSSQVAEQIKKEFNIPVWAGFHPIATSLSPKIEKEKARNILGWASETKMVLFFGLIRKYKGLELLLQSFTESPLKEQDSICLYVAGECYEDPNKYTTLVKDLKIESRVTLDFTYKNPNEAALLFSAADAVAQTYHSATQSGITPYAYFYNNPLLVSDISGLNELIKKDTTGLCTPKKSKAIATHLIELLEEGNFKKYKENIIGAKDKYQWSYFVKKWHHFIENI